MSRRIAALALIGLTVTGLASCTASPDPATNSATGDAPGDDGQSVAQACALVQDTISAATADVEDVGAEDPAAAVDAMRAAASELSESAGSITNDAMAALLPSLQELFTQTADIMGAIVDGDTSKAGEMTALGEKFSSTTDEFQTLCLS